MNIIRQHFFRYMSVLLLSTLIVDTGWTIQNKTHQRIDGVDIYIGLVSAKIIRENASAAELMMHGGVPSGRNTYHLVVSIVDSETGENITNAKVNAKVAGVGFYATSKSMEQMRLNDRVSFGNYFIVPENIPYRVWLTLDIPGKKTIETVFDFDSYMR